MPATSTSLKSTNPLFLLAARKLLSLSLRPSSAVPILHWRCSQTQSSQTSTRHSMIDAPSGNRRSCALHLRPNPLSFGVSAAAKSQQRRLLSSMGNPAFGRYHRVSISETPSSFPPRPPYHSHRLGPFIPFLSCAPCIKVSNDRPDLTFFVCLGQTASKNGDHRLARSDTNLRFANLGCPITPCSHPLFLRLRSDNLCPAP